MKLISIDKMNWNKSSKSCSMICKADHWLHKSFWRSFLAEAKISTKCTDGFACACLTFASSNSARKVRRITTSIGFIVSHVARPLILN
jgi:hypothetical protein